MRAIAVKQFCVSIAVFVLSLTVHTSAATDDVIFRCFFTKDTVSVKFSPSGAYYVLSGDKIHHGVMVFNSDGTVYKRLVMPADDGDYARLEQRGFFNDSMLITLGSLGVTAEYYEVDNLLLGNRRVIQVCNNFVCFRLKRKKILVPTTIARMLVV